MRDQAVATARALSAMTWVVVGGLAVLAGVAIAFPDHLVRVGAEAVALAAIGLAIRASLRAGRIRLAGTLGIGGFLAFLSVVSYTAGGVRGPLAPGFLLVIVLATLLLGERAGILATVASAASLGFMALLEAGGRLPPVAVPHTPLTFFLVMLVLLLGAAVAQIAFARAVASSTANAERELEERLRAEAALRQAQRTEALATLARGVAHDFNNLLAAIMGNAQMLVKDLPPAGEASEMAEEILQASRRGRDLVSKLLTFSRSREVDAVVVNLAGVAGEVVSLLRASTPSTIELRAELSGPVLILADPTQVHQVILNLVTNAVQALGRMPGVVTLVVVSTELPQPGLPAPGLPAGRYARATVADDGPGMSTEVSMRVFDPFFTTKAPGQGTGLGLSVVHGIMKGLGGAVTVESSPGKGSTFTLWFPEAAPRESPKIAPSSQESQAPRPRRLPPRLPVLLVDDEVKVAVAVARQLESRGCVVTVLGGPGAAEAAVRVPPQAFDVAVLDLTMPGLDGLALLAALRESRPDLPAVLLSGNLAAADAKRLAAQRPLVQLAKPFSDDDLELSIRKALDPGGSTAT